MIPVEKVVIQEIRLSGFGVHSPKNYQFARGGGNPTGNPVFQVRAVSFRLSLREAREASS